MPITATVTGKDKRGGILLVVYTLVPSGTYPAPPGEPLDFALSNGFTTRQPKSVQITGKAGFIYLYDLANKTFRVFVNTAGGANAALGEHTNAAYVAGILADVITAEATWSL